MRIRRQPQLIPQGTRAENPSDGSLLSSAVMESKPSSPPQHDAEIIVTSIDDLSMIYSASKFRASVNWLDRLRAAKGFPVDSHPHIEEFLSLQECSPEDTQQNDIACLKQENMTMGDGGSNSMDGMQRKAAENFSCGTHDCSILNMPLPHQDLSFDSGSTRAEPHHPCNSSQSLGKQQSVASAENNIAGTKASFSPKLNKVLPSRSTVFHSSLCQDNNPEASLPELYFNMFADLFCMETGSLNSPLSADEKKRQRKQEKPKVCSSFGDPDPPCAVGTSSQLQPCEFDAQASCPLDSGNPTSQSEVAAAVKMDMPSSSPEVEGLEHILAEQKRTPNKVLTDASNKKDDTEVERGPMNELFIIDTSFPGWKAKKFIMRKGNGWRIRDKGVTSASSDSTVKETKKRPGTPPTSNMKNGSTKVIRQCEPKPCEPSTCKEKIKKDAAKCGECPRSSEGECPRFTEHVARLWSTVPHTHIRSSRKRRKTTIPEEAASKEIPETTSAIFKPSEKSTAFASDYPANSQLFASDHPANQPKEGIVYSIYQVFMQAGKSGLTPREAVSRILEQGLPGLHEGGVVPRVEVLKVVSNSPYFMPLEESKYILCSALVGDEDLMVGGELSAQNSKHDDNDNGFNSLDNSKSTKQQGMSQYWAACAAIRRARTGKTRRKPSLGSYFLNTPTSFDANNETGILSGKKRLKSVKQDVTGLGNPCNRSDGKGWHCPLRAKVGYLLCDHHLDRLRTRVKSHIKSKMLSITKTSKDERKRILSGSWMVKKVVERSRIGRPSHVSFRVPSDAQEKFPDNSSEVLGSTFS